MDFLLNPIVNKFEKRLETIQKNVTEIQTSLRRLSLLLDALPDPAPLCRCPGAPVEARVGSSSGRRPAGNSGTRPDSPVRPASVKRDKCRGSISLGTLSSRRSSVPLGSS